MTPQLARRVLARVKADHRRPLTPDEETEIIVDWLAGTSREVLARRHRRGLKTIRTLLERSIAEAEHAAGPGRRA